MLARKAAGNERLSLREDLLQALREVAPDSLPEDDGALGEALEGFVARAQSAWPRIDLSAAAFVSHLAKRLPKGGLTEEGLGAVRAADLYLAAACLARDPAALEMLEQRYFSQISLYLRSKRLDATTLQEVAQLVRERILVGSSEGGPRLAEYLGRGSLEGWFRVTVARTALNLLEREKRYRPVGALEGRLAQSHKDLELDYIRQRYRPEFEAAFAEALGALSSHQKSLLRFYLVDGLNLDQIAAVRGVHPSTVSRHIAAARRKVLDEATRLLRERLRASDSEVQSLLRLLRSQLDVSIVGQLRGSPGGSGA